MEKAGSLMNFSAQTGFHAQLWLAKTLWCALYLFIFFVQGLVFQSPLNDIRLCPEAQGSAPRRKSICRPLPGSTPPRPGSQTSTPC